MFLCLSAFLWAEFKLEKLYLNAASKGIVRSIADPEFKSIASGKFSKNIIGVKSKSEMRDDKEFEYVLKEVCYPQDKSEICEPPDDKLLRDRDIKKTRTWAEKHIYSTSPRQEILNLLKVRNDPDVLNWNQREEERDDDYKLTITLTAQVYGLNDGKEKRYIALINGAPGMPFLDVLIDATQNDKDKAFELMKAFGRKLADLHTFSQIVLLDLHAENIFISLPLKQFSAIDNHTITYTQKWRGDPDVMSRLFAFERERFVDVFKYWKSCKEHFGNNKPLCSRIFDAFEISYKDRFDENVARYNLPYKYLAGVYKKRAVQ